MAHDDCEGPPNSAWERWFCGPQCVDVSRCCGEGEPNLRNDGTDDEMVSVAHCDELADSLDGDGFPIMAQPRAAYATYRVQSAIPWADLSGPRKLAASTSMTSRSTEGSVPPQLLRSRASEVVKKCTSRSVSPSINPYSKFGFITVTVPARSYMADPSDVMDVEFARHLLALEREAAAALELRRLAHGRYEVQGRHISVRWGPGNHGSELLACEDELEGMLASADGDGEQPLGEYLRHLGDIAASIRRPAERRILTFVHDGAIGDRFDAMKIACEQARLRERAARGRVEVSPRW